MYSRRICGNPKYDAATANWGHPWRMPTSDEFSELAILLHGSVNGGFTYKGSGGKISLLAAGLRDGDKLELAKQDCYYWCGTYDGYPDWWPGGYSSVCVQDIDIYVGLPIRPVMD